MNTTVIFSAASDEWSTPKETYDALNAEFAFTDDPCPIGAIDGLEREWGLTVFVNPPYSNVRGFMDKALTEIKAGRSKTIVFLVPSRTDTKWWHECVMPYASEIRFIKGRLKFGNSKNCAPFPSCIIVFRGDFMTFKPLKGCPCARCSHLNHVVHDDCDCKCHKKEINELCKCGHISLGHEDGECFGTTEILEIQCNCKKFERMDTDNKEKETKNE